MVRLRAIPEKMSQTALPEKAWKVVSKDITPRIGNSRSVRRDVYSMGTGSNVQKTTVRAQTASARRDGRSSPPGYRSARRGTRTPRMSPMALRDGMGIPEVVTGVAGRSGSIRAGAKL